MSVPTRKLVDKEGREIFSGDRKVVEPILHSTGSGESLLVKDYEGHGLTALQGHAWYGGVHLAGDIVTITIPLDIKLKDIASVGWLEKCKTAEIYNYTLNVVFQIDLDENGIYTETSDDRFLFAMWRDDYGHTSWEKVDALAAVDTHESVDHFKLYDGAWTKKATPDGTIPADTLGSFAAFQATDLGKYRVKAVQIVYSGEKTGTADYWVMVANVAINGIFYELHPKHFGGAVYVNSDEAAADAARRFETSPKKLRDIIIKVDNAGQYFGDADDQTYFVDNDGTIGITQIDISTLYFKNHTPGANGTVHILAVEE